MLKNKAFLFFIRIPTFFKKNKNKIKIKRKYNTGGHGHDLVNRKETILELVFRAWTI